jgi:uncharacterized integral membrane protein (TIGR00697 family)
MQGIRYKYLTLISSIVVTLYIVTAVVQNRLVSIHGFDICAAIFVYPFSYLLCDISAEVYGYKITRQILWCSLLSWIISGLFIAFTIRLPTPIFWSSYSQEFNVVMSPYLRTIMSGIVAVVAGQFINIYTISKFKILTRGRFFWMRSVSSCLTGDLITTVLSLSFIFLGRMPFHEITQLIVYELTISIVIQAIFAIPATLIVNFLKKSENADAFDYNVNFNPFKFSTADDLPPVSPKITE